MVTRTDAVNDPALPAVTPPERAFRKRAVTVFPGRAFARTDQPLRVGRAPPSTGRVDPPHGVGRPGGARPGGNPARRSVPRGRSPGRAPTAGGSTVDRPPPVLDRPPERRSPVGADRARPRPAPRGARGRIGRRSTAGRRGEAPGAGAGTPGAATTSPAGGPPRRSPHRCGDRPASTVDRPGTRSGREDARTKDAVHPAVIRRPPGTARLRRGSRDAPDRRVCDRSAPGSNAQESR